MAATESAQLAQLLQALQSSNNAERQQAETLYQQTKASAPDQLICSMLAVIADGGISEKIRQQAAVLLRQLVSMGSEKDFAFSRLSPQQRQEFAAGLLQRYETEQNPKVQNAISDVISKLAETSCDKTDSRGWIVQGCAGWPALMPLVLQMGNVSVNPRPESAVCTIKLLKDMIGTFREEIASAGEQLAPLMQSAISHADLKVRSAIFQLICQIVIDLDKKAWASLLATAGVLNQILKDLSQSATDQTLSVEFQDCLEIFRDVAEEEPNFFKQQLLADMDLANFMACLSKEKKMDEVQRGFGLEWLVTMCERKPKWLSKHLQHFAPLALDCSMNMMLEVDDGEAELKEWIERMDDEEDGEEDLYDTGSRAIDRIVEAMGMDSVSQALFALVGRYSSDEAWQSKHAALTAVKQTVEYVEEDVHVDEMAKLLIAYVDHPHPRVQYTALHAIGQLANDQAPRFQEEWHKTVMPVFLRKMDCQIDRIASMAMSAFVSFGEELDDTLMTGYAPDFMQKLVTRLQTTGHRMVQEEAITSIAVVAGVIGDKFSQFYDQIMPLLKQFVIKSTNAKECRLRGKAFECMSLLGVAVGREKFKPDVEEVMFEMMKVPDDENDPEQLQREYIKEASERICKCMKEDFKPFLPMLLPTIFQSLKVESEAQPAPAASNPMTNADDSDEDTYINKEGKMVKVHTDKFDECTQSVELLGSFCREMGGSYFDWIPQTAEALLPFLSSSEVNMLNDDARREAFQTWAGLIKSARIGATERGQEPILVMELLRTFLKHSLQLVVDEEDAETVSDAADGIKECLKNAGPGVLSAEEVPQMTRQLLALMDKSFARTAQLEKDKNQSLTGTPQELQDEDEDDDEETDEENCRRRLEDAIGSVMEVAPQHFLPCLSECGNRLSQWLAVKDNRVLALFLGCDLLNHLKDQSEPVWPILMPAVFQALTDKDPDIRIPACYAVNLAAPLAKFAEGAAEAYKILTHTIQTAPPKKRDEKSKICRDNAVAALFTLAKEKPQQCPEGLDPWQTVVHQLPLKDDEEEGKKVHESIADLVLAQHAGLLGPNGANLGKVLSALAEVHSQEDLSSKETDMKIQNIFKMLPRDTVQNLATAFSEKQQKKIEKMLS